MLPVRGCISDLEFVHLTKNGIEEYGYWQIAEVYSLIKTNSVVESLTTLCWMLSLDVGSVAGRTVSSYNPVSHAAQRFTLALHEELIAAYFELVVVCASVLVQNVWLSCSLLGGSDIHFAAHQSSQAHCIQHSQDCFMHMHMHVLVPWGVALMKVS